MAALVSHDAGAFRWRLDPDFARLLGPTGIRLQDWLRTGQATVVKQGPHRVVYRILLDGATYYLKHNLIPDRITWARQLIRPNKAWREYRRAMDLAERGIPTAEPLAWGKAALLGKGESLLVTRGLEQTQSLQHFLEQVLPTWPARHVPRMRQRLAVELGAFLARLHEAGICHDDLHAGNILFRRSNDDELELFLIDLTAVRVGPPLAWAKTERNLVTLNRWFMNRASRSDRLRFWHSYLQARGLMPAGTRWPRTEEPKRLARYLERATWKSLVDMWRHRDHRCTAQNRYYVRLRGPGVAGYAVARFDGALLDTLLKDPEAPFRFPGAAPLKQTASAAVVEFDATVNGQKLRLVYKRFRVRKWTDPWAALVRETAAMRSWRLGQGFCERGLPTARPLVVLERRRHGLTYDGYLLMEKLERTLPLHESLAAIACMPPAESRHLQRTRIALVARAVRELHRRQLAHADLKANNILLTQLGGPRRASDPTRKPWASPSFLADPLPGVWFIDLVGVTVCRKLSRRRRVQSLARLNASFHQSRHLSRTDRLRFLRTYLVWGLVSKHGWKDWWRAIAAATQAKVARNRRLGRELA
jgi:tRNA A-37 threonylcarbamoyl transferase component Bud32